MNASKAKGTAWETRIVEWLGATYANVERRALSGTRDRGDIAGLPGVVIEAKSVKPTLLSAVFNLGTTELQREVDNDNAALGLLCVKRPGKTDPGSAYWLVDPRHVDYIISLVQVDQERV